MKPIILTLLLLCCQHLQSQSLMFETKLYIKDAIGTIDSVTVAFDTLSNGVYNPTLGELDLETPFDSVLDVRCAHYFRFISDTDYTISKKIVLDGNFFVNLSCVAVKFCILLVKAKYQPITVSWDKNAFDEYCIESSFMTPDDTWHFTDPTDAWASQTFRRTACMTKQDSFQLTLGSSQGPEGEYSLFDILPSESNPNDTIWTLQLIFLPKPYLVFSPCKLISGTEDAVIATSGLVVSPNPAYEQCIIAEPEGFEAVQVGFYHLSGRQVEVPWSRSTDGMIQAQIKHLDPGLYGLLLKDKNGSTKTAKLVKSMLRD